MRNIIFVPLITMPDANTGIGECTLPNRTNIYQLNSHTLLNTNGTKHFINNTFLYEHVISYIHDNAHNMCW
jgi:hypothetical protein